MNALRHTSHQPPIMSVNTSEYTPTSAPLFPIYQVLDTFRAFTYGEPTVKSHHRSLFYFLIEKVRSKGSLGRFQLPREEGMDGSRISKDLYGKTLQDLHDWGFIHYTPGANRFLTPIIEVFPDDSRVQNIGAYRVAYQVSTQESTPSPSGTNKRLLDKGTLDQQSEALSLAEKKIKELQEKIARLEAQASASHTEGGAPAESQPESRVVPPAAEDDEYHAQPRDVQMVDDFLKNHHDPRMRQYAGKGYLFWSEYEGKAKDGKWVRNNGSPVTNWRAVILSFGFREPTSFSSHANQSKQYGSAAARRAGEATRSGSARQPLAEGIQIGEPLTGKLDDL